jgi:hypothetical protein
MPNRLNIVMFIKNSFTTTKIKIENTYYKKLVYNMAMLMFPFVQNNHKHSSMIPIGTLTVLNTVIG